MTTKKEGASKRRTPEIREQDPAPPPVQEPARSPDVRDRRDTIRELDLDIPEQVETLRGVSDGTLDPVKVQDDLARQARVAGVGLALMEQDQNRHQAPSYLTEEDPDFVYYIRCTSTDCRGPGVWIHTQPHGLLKPNDWESSYKPRTALWPGREVYCQCCYQRHGVQRRLPIFHKDGMPHVNMRHVQKIRRSKFDEMMQKVQVS